MNTGKELTLTITVQEEQLASNVGSGLAGHVYRRHAP